MSSTSQNQSPSGVVTFLFTDIEGSTKLWESHPQDMQTALADHDEILRASIVEASGVVFSTAGDAFAAAFQTPDRAVEAAASAQRALEAHDWPGAATIRVRMGVHTGMAHQRDNDYFGPTLNRAARLMSAAHGGQTVVSTTTQELLGDEALIDMGEHSAPPRRVSPATNRHPDPHRFCGDSPSVSVAQAPQILCQVCLTRGIL